MALPAPGTAPAQALGTATAATVPEGNFPVRPPGRPRSEESRRAIMAATVSLLGETGFPGLSMGAVATRAGVSKATLYRWWPSKVALVVSAVHEAAVEQVCEVDTGSLRGDVRSLLAGLLALMRSELGAAIAALAAEAERDSIVRETLEREVLHYRREIVGRVLARAEARGEARPGLDLDLLSDIAVAVLIHRFNLAPEHLDENLVEGIADLLVEGIRPR